MTLMGTMKVLPVTAAVWSPLSLPNLVAWWDASDTATITASGGDVSQWDDKSGNGHHLVQGTAARQLKTGTRTVNSLNVLDHSGADGKRMTVTGFSLTAFSIFYVIDRDGGFAWAGDASANSPRLQTESGNWKFEDGSNSYGSTAAGTGAQHVLYTRSAGNSMNAWLTGVTQMLTNQSVGSAAWDGMCVGGLSQTDILPANGGIAEMFVTSDVVTSGDRSSAWSYIDAKWGT